MMQAPNIFIAENLLPSFLLFYCQLLGLSILCGCRSGNGQLQTFTFLSLVPLSDLALCVVVDRAMVSYNVLPSFPKFHCQTWHSVWLQIQQWLATTFYLPFLGSTVRLGTVCGCRYSNRQLQPSTFLSLVPLSDLALCVVVDRAMVSYNLLPSFPWFHCQTWHSVWLQIGQWLATTFYLPFLGSTVRLGTLCGCRYSSGQLQWFYLPFLGSTVRLGTVSGCRSGSGQLQPSTFLSLVPLSDLALCMVVDRAMVSYNLLSSFPWFHCQTWHSVWLQIGQWLATTFYLPFLGSTVRLGTLCGCRYRQWLATTFYLPFLGSTVRLGTLCGCRSGNGQLQPFTFLSLVPLSDLALCVVVDRAVVSYNGLPSFPWFHCQTWHCVWLQIGQWLATTVYLPFLGSTLRLGTVCGCRYSSGQLQPSTFLSLVPLSDLALCVVVDRAMVSYNLLTFLSLVPLSDLALCVVVDIAVVSYNLLPSFPWFHCQTWHSVWLQIGQWLATTFYLPFLGSTVRLGTVCGCRSGNGQLQPFIFLSLVPLSDLALCVVVDRAMVSYNLLPSFPWFHCQTWHSVWLQIQQWLATTFYLPFLGSTVRLGTVCGCRYSSGQLQPGTFLSLVPLSDLALCVVVDRAMVSYNLLPSFPWFHCQTWHCVQLQIGQWLATTFYLPFLGSTVRLGTLCGCRSGQWLATTFYLPFLGSTVRLGTVCGCRYRQWLATTFYLPFLGSTVRLGTVCGCRSGQWFLGSTVRLGTVWLQIGQWLATTFYLPFLDSTVRLGTLCGCRSGNGSLVPLSDLALCVVVDRAVVPWFHCQTWHCVWLQIGQWFLGSTVRLGTVCGCRSDNGQLQPFTFLSLVPLSDLALCVWLQIGQWFLGSTVRLGTLCGCRYRQWLATTFYLPFLGSTVRLGTVCGCRYSSGQLQPGTFLSLVPLSDLALCLVVDQAMVSYNLLPSFPWFHCQTWHCAWLQIRQWLATTFYLPFLGSTVRLGTVRGCRSGNGSLVLQLSDLALCMVVDRAMVPWFHCQTWHCVVVDRAMVPWFHCQTWHSVCGCRSGNGSLVPLSDLALCLVVDQAMVPWFHCQTWHCVWLQIGQWFLGSTVRLGTVHGCRSGNGSLVPLSDLALYGCRAGNGSLGSTVRLGTLYGCKSGNGSLVPLSDLALCGCRAGNGSLVPLSDLALCVVVDRAMVPWFHCQTWHCVVVDRAMEPWFHCQTWHCVWLQIGQWFLGSTVRTWHCVWLQIGLWFLGSTVRLGTVCGCRSGNGSLVPLSDLALCMVVDRAMVPWFHCQTWHSVWLQIGQWFLGSTVRLGTVWLQIGQWFLGSTVRLGTVYGCRSGNGSLVPLSDLALCMVVDRAMVPWFHCQTWHFVWLQIGQWFLGSTVRLGTVRGCRSGNGSLLPLSDLALCGTQIGQWFLGSTVRLGTVYGCRSGNGSLVPLSDLALCVVVDRAMVPWFHCQTWHSVWLQIGQWYLGSTVRLGTLCGCRSGSGSLVPLSDLALCVVVDRAMVPWFHSQTWHCVWLQIRQWFLGSTVRLGTVCGCRSGNGSLVPLSDLALCVVVDQAMVSYNLLPSFPWFHCQTWHCVVVDRAMVPWFHCQTWHCVWLQIGQWFLGSTVRLGTLCGCRSGNGQLQPFTFLSLVPLSDLALCVVVDRAMVPWFHCQTWHSVCGCRSGNGSLVPLSDLALCVVVDRAMVPWFHCQTWHCEWLQIGQWFLGSTVRLGTLCVVVDRAMVPWFHCQTWHSVWLQIRQWLATTFYLPFLGSTVRLGTLCGCRSGNGSLVPLSDLALCVVVDRAMVSYNLLPSFPWFHCQTWHSVCGCRSGNGSLVPLSDLALCVVVDRAMVPWFHCQTWHCVWLQIGQWFLGSTVRLGTVCGCRSANGSLVPLSDLALCVVVDRAMVSYTLHAGSVLISSD